ncbi:unnamed protein product [Ilex paraguariensis]|uniref:Uncharacterized protein n=1 Tax=Ilex paraguariensis TaxID=185542 RepID=A0ABC8UKA6_9AQUA
MNQKLGGWGLPTATASLAWSCAVIFVSLLSGASVVHSIFKPDLVRGNCPYYRILLHGFSMPMTLLIRCM